MKRNAKRDEQADQRTDEQPEQPGDQPAAQADPQPPARTAQQLRRPPTQHWPRVWTVASDDTSRPRWPSTTPRPLIALVTIVDIERGRMFTRTFTDSPVRIGSHRGSDLQLDDVSVARHHGDISFEDGLVFYRDRAWARPTSVDDRRVARGEAVALSERSVIAIGRYRIDVSLCRPPVRDRERERSRKVTPLFLPGLAAAEVERPPTVTLRGFRVP